VLNRAKIYVTVFEVNSIHNKKMVFIKLFFIKKPYNRDSEMLFLKLCNFDLTLSTWMFYIKEDVNNRVKM